VDTERYIRCPHRFIERLELHKPGAVKAIIWLRV
jgi:hypothetical protein